MDPEQAKAMVPKDLQQLQVTAPAESRFKSTGKPSKLANQGKIKPLWNSSSTKARNAIQNQLSSKKIEL